MFDSFPWPFVGRLAARGARWRWRQHGELTVVEIESAPTEPPGFEPERVPIGKLQAEFVDDNQPVKPRLVAYKTITFDLLQQIPPTIAKDLEPATQAFIAKRKKLERLGCALYNVCRTVHPGVAVPIEKCVCTCESPCDFDPRVVMVEGQRAVYFDDFVKYLRLIGLIYDRIRREKTKASG